MSDQVALPCRCGETHRGDYALYDYGHHNCFHDAPLHPLDTEEGHYVCPECGKDFHTQALVEDDWERWAHEAPELEKNC